MPQPDKSHGYHAHGPCPSFVVTKLNIQDKQENFGKTLSRLPGYSQESIIFVANET